MDTKKLYLPETLFDGEQFLPSPGLVEQDGVICDIGSAAAMKQAYPDAAEVNWDGLVMLPGTVNAHNHSFQSLLRGIAADRPFLEWRDEALYKYSPLLSPEDLYNGALFAFGEMLRYGVTTVCDFFYLHNDGLESDEAIIRAAEDIGIRLVLARTMYDWDGAPNGYVESVNTACDNTKSLFFKYKNNPMVSVVPAPHSLHAASLEMIRAGHELARELGTAFHIHVAEEPFEVEQIQKQYGKRTLELLDSIGVVDESMVIIHGVWLDGGEIKTLASKRGKLAYCPSSNMFLADGITDIEKMLSLGVKIGLGTDGACSNNRISVFEEMRMAPLLQKAYKHNALCVDYRQAFKMGTEWGGELLGLPVGKLQKSFFADFVGVDLYDLSMQPVTKHGAQLLPNIVYSLQPQAVRKVVVNGKERACDGSLKSIPEKEIIKKIAQTMSRMESMEGQ